MNEMLQSRIIALELIQRALLTHHLTAHFDDPKSALKKLRSDFMASLQHLNRPLNDSSDRIWEQVSDALNKEFDQVLIRLDNILE